MNLSNLSKVISVVLASFIFLFVSNTALASNFYLSSEKNDLTLGEVVPVSVVVDTNGESVNGVSAFLSYPNDALEVVWISYGEAFPVQAEESYENGVIKISRGSFTGEVGNINIATIGFRAKAVGAASVAFLSESAAPRTSDSSDSLNLNESKGEIFTIEQSQPESNILVTLLQKLLSLLG